MKIYLVLQVQEIMDGMTGCRWDAHTSFGSVGLLVWLLVGVNRRHKEVEDAGK